MATLKHVKTNSKWKKVEIAPVLFSNKDFETLISIEELTDYELVETNAGQIADDDTSQTATAAEKRNKTKKKKKKKKKQVAPPSETLVESKQEEEVTEAINVINPKKAKKAKKKKPPKKDEQKKGLTLKRKHGKMLMIGSQDVVDLNEDEDKLSEAKAKQMAEKDKGEGPKPKKAKTEREKLTHHTDPSVSADMRAWKNLFVPSQVLKALQHQGFTSPTSIQALALPSAIRDRMDIVGAAETGSGKTLAFGIPVLHHILQHEARKQQQQGVEVVEEEEKGEERDSSSDDSEADVKAEVDDGGDEEEEEEEDDNDEKEDGVKGGHEGSDSGVPEDLDLTDDEDGDYDLPPDDEDGDYDLPPDDEDGDYDLPPDDEDILEIDGDETGCVRVINNIEFEAADLEKVKATSKGDKPLVALILEPTRELAIQVKNHLMAAAKYTDIRIATVVGGMAAQKQQRVLKQCPEIVIATPGRLWELIQQGDPHLTKVTGIHKLVIDEADRMVEKGHFEELTKLLDMINVDENRKRLRQTFVFSATLTMLHSGPQRRLKKKKKEKMDTKKKLELLMSTIGIKDRPKIIDLTTKAGTAETLTEARINCTVDEKDLYLYYFLKQYPGRTLVFTNSKDCIRRLMSIFVLLRCNPLPLHSDMHQRQRLKNLDRFSANDKGVLIASDVAARGLDIPNVQHVIHFQVPRTVENYVHRSGRTARAMKEGLSVMLVGPEDVRNYRKIVQTLNRNEDLPLFPVEFHTTSSLRDVITLARKIDTEDHRFKKKKRKNDWFVKAAEEIDMMLDERALEDPSDSMEQQKHKQKQQMMKAQLDVLLKRPLTQKLFSGKYPTKMGRLIAPEHTQDNDAIQKMKRDEPAQKEMMQYVAAHPKVIKKKRENRKTRKNEKRKKKKMKMMTG
ncbi:ATP-dependent RNA helicase DDX24-like isoform X1 [Haliotis rufescens]|uniref:ATP-dependent RNA helicase DDX24-like isoform X1 n=1 Tax=Haliotis rufescens TaxID=6454 RepID=UPI00201EEA41|nr:ATP-dependent RNA helicase DDX24-like isoform X1 [Haliotis rufescens]